MSFTEAEAAQLLRQAQSGRGAASPSRSRPSKYKAVKTTVDGIVFDSKKEAQRYHELTLLQKAGRIQLLRTQVAFLLTAGREHSAVGHYVADFCYEERQGEHWEPVVEDAKGMRTAMYRWKAKHMLAEHGIKIRET